ncbi:MAG: NADPH:quinone reductase [Cytophagia bacterium]|nr:NADPH:quinone reductase [Cytophagia bacterium]NBW37266.1 NADPH:quinone reductase [Cytophagia bacterium]
MMQVELSQFGSPDELKLVERKIPLPKSGEVIIKTEAIGVNYADILRRRNQYFQSTPLPYVLGAEAVGKIIAVGEGVSEPYSVGASVLAILPGGGGYSEYVAAIAQYCIILPPNVDAKTATAIFVQGSTAQLMIAQVAKDVKGKSVLINAASGGVGSILVQLAKLNGAKVIAACSNADKLRIASANGADITLNYSEANWSEKLRAANNGKGVDIAFEMVGGEVYNETIKSLAQGGQLIIYGCASGVQGNIHQEYFVDQNITQSGFNLAFYIGNKMQLWQEAMGTVIGLIVKGQLKIQTPKTFALTDAAEAHRQIENRKTTGKVVLTPNN